MELLYTFFTLFFFGVFILALPADTNLVAMANNISTPGENSLQVRKIDPGPAYLGVCLYATNNCDESQGFEIITLHPSECCEMKPNVRSLKPLGHSNDNLLAYDFFIFSEPKCAGFTELQADLDLLSVRTTDPLRTKCSDHLFEDQVHSKMSMILLLKN